MPNCEAPIRFRERAHMRGAAIVSGDWASRHRANSAKNAVSPLRRGDDSLSAAIAMLVNVPNAAPPKTSDG